MKSRTFIPHVFLTAIMVVSGLLPHLQVPANGYSGEDKTGDMTLRVLLYSQLDTEELRVFSHEGHINISSADGFSIRIFDGQTGARFEVEKDKIIFIREGQRMASRSWEIRAIEGYNRILNPKAEFRYYHGTINLTAKNGLIRAVNTVNLEDYVSGVIGGEMNFTHPEVLKVQAVIGRTYALWNLAQFRDQPYDLTDHVLNQVYIGESVFKPWIREAADATRGEVLTHLGNVILAAYHSTCGGVTASNHNVWSGGFLPYLQPVKDGYMCEPSQNYYWKFEASHSELHALIGKHLGKSVTSISVNETDAYGRVKSINAYSADNANTQMRANEFRLTINGNFDHRSLRSAFFALYENDDTYIFLGRGMGHGVGLCQWGALGFAEEGKSYKQILKHYYTGVSLVDIRELHEFRSGNVRF